MIGRIFALILLVAAAVAGGRDALMYMQTGHYTPAELGDLWSAVDRTSLTFVQAVVQRDVHPALWQEVLSPVLLSPAWAVLAIAGAILGLLFHRRRKHRWRSGSLG